MTWIEYAVVREAHAIRTIAGYYPKGAEITLQWAGQIEARERAGIEPPGRHFTAVKDTPSPEELKRRHQRKLLQTRLRAAIKTVKQAGLTSDAAKLQEFYDTNYR